MPIQETQDLDLRQFVLDCTSFGPAEISRIATEMSRRNEKIKDLRDGVNELAAKASDLSPSMMVKLGVCQYLMGRYDDALESLKHSDGGALAQFYMAKIHATILWIKSLEKKSRKIHMIFFWQAFHVKHSAVPA